MAEEIVAGTEGQLRGAQEINLARFKPFLQFHITLSVALTCPNRPDVEPIGVQGFEAAVLTPTLGGLGIRQEIEEHALVIAAQGYNRSRQLLACEEFQHALRVVAAIDVV